MRDIGMPDFARSPISERAAAVPNRLGSRATTTREARSMNGRSAAENGVGASTSTTS